MKRKSGTIDGYERTDSARGRAVQVGEIVRFRDIPNTWATHLLLLASSKLFPSVLFAR